MDRPNATIEIHDSNTDEWNEFAAGTFPEMEQLWNLIEIMADLTSADSVRLTYKMDVAVNTKE